LGWVSWPDFLSLAWGRCVTPVRTRFCRPKNWGKMTQKIKMSSSNAQPTPARFQIKPVLCAAMPSAPGRARTRNVTGGSRGKTCAIRAINIQIGNRRHRHAVVQRDCVKSHKPPIGRFFIGSRRNTRMELIPAAVGWGDVIPS